MPCSNVVLVLRSVAVSAGWHSATVCSSAHDDRHCDSGATYFIMAGGEDELFLEENVVEVRGTLQAGIIDGEIDCVL